MSIGQFSFKKTQMAQKINLTHPTGKKAIRMDKDKYTMMEKSVLSALNSNEELTHTELLKIITDDFKKYKINFEGSIEWHMEWVKLDLESKKKIRRISDKAPIKFKIS